MALAKFAKPENHEQIFGVRNKVKDLMDHINKAKDELYKNKDLAQISEKYWKNVSSFEYSLQRISRFCFFSHKL